MKQRQRSGSVRGALRKNRGATQLAAQGASELQIQCEGKWKSRAFVTYVRAAGEGAESVSAALVKTG